jgi:hypothetical protein
MNFSDWFDYLAVSAALFPYWKAALKYLSSLCLGLFALVVSKSTTGGAAMRQPAFDDYLIAHPLMVSLWVCGFVYLFLNLSPQGFLGSLVTVLFFAFWLRQWLQSLTLILERQAAEPVSEQGKETLPCIQPSSI